MTYQERLCAHLAAYKRRVLHVEEPGVFNYRGTDVLREHILPLHQAELNLFPLARSEERRHGLVHTRHRYFHHLNSSQAFAFNLFLPFFGRGGAAAESLLRALGQEGPLRSWELEAIPVKDEETNIDALWVDENGATTFCEVKLSEAEFGKGELDERHRRKLREIYEPGLRGHVDARLLREAEFFSAYQILRNVWHLVRVGGSSLLFLLPRENTGLWSTLPSVIGSLTPGIQARVRTCAIEDVLAQLSADALCPPDLRSYADAMRAKYVPDAT